MSLLSRLFRSAPESGRPLVMHRLADAVRARVARFSRDEGGVITVNNLFLFMTTMFIGSAAVDVTQLYAAREQLQVAADTGAHAALVNFRAGDSAARARTDAVRVIRYGMPVSVYGNVVDSPTTDILFGRYDARRDRFIARTEATVNSVPDRAVTAVYVTTQQAKASGNAAGTFFLRMLGIGGLDVRASAVYAMEPDRCASLQGLFAIGEILPNSDNWFVSKVCVHSEEGVGTKNFPKFRDGSTVSAPNLSDLTCTNNCAEFNQARRVSSYDLNQFLDPIRQSGIDTPTSLYADVKEALPNWDWTKFPTAVTPITSAASIATPANVNGRVIYYDCRSGSKDVDLNGTYTGAVMIFHDCSVNIPKSNDVLLSDTVVYTTRTGDDSIDILGSGLQVGTDPNCTGTGSAALLTRGGIKTPSKTKFQNGIIRALGDLQFAAKFGNEPGYESSGLSIIAGGTINPQSENRFRGCPTTAEIDPSLWIVRLAR